MPLSAGINRSSTGWHANSLYVAPSASFALRADGALMAHCQQRNAGASGRPHAQTTCKSYSVEPHHAGRGCVGDLPYMHSETAAAPPDAAWKAASALAASLLSACMVLADAPGVGQAQAMDATYAGTSTSSSQYTITGSNVAAVTADIQLPAPDLQYQQLPTTAAQQQLGSSRRMWQASSNQQDGSLWFLGHSPLLVLTKKHPVWLHLAVLAAANVAGIKLVQELLKRLGDRSEPVTLVRLQLGLVHPPGSSGGKALTHLRERLSRLGSMIKMGQHGLWLIVEEAALELAQHQRAAALADVDVVHLDSKREAYGLFGELAVHEAGKARAEEASAHVEGEGVCAVAWEKAHSRLSLRAATIEPEDDVSASALSNWLAAQPHETWDEDGGCDDAMVVTFVVLARGHLQVPTSVQSWQDACDILKQVCGLSSTRLMAVDLTWAPSVDGTYLTRQEMLRDYAKLKPLAAHNHHHHHN